MLGAAVLDVLNQARELCEVDVDVNAAVGRRLRAHTHIGKGAGCAQGRCVLFQGRLAEAIAWLGANLAANLVGWNQSIADGDDLGDDGSVRGLGKTERRGQEKGE